MAIRIGAVYRDRYDVVERIGEGAFARVYRARDLTTGGEVALKVIKESYPAEREVIERFQREVFAVASISSPHVVALHDFGISGEGDDFFMVMDLVEGPSLRKLIGSRSWSPTDVLVIIGQVARALAAAHERGIIHRDLKPENVVLVEHQGGRWQAKVLDFGLAKLAELEQTLELEPLTRTGLTVGTPQYLAPEQIQGETLDGRADLFALGILTYEMLTGKRPWNGDSAREVMISVLSRMPPAAVQLHPSLMPRVTEVNQFFLRALAKKREERPADAAAFFSELEGALFGGERPFAPFDEVSSHAIVVDDLLADEDATEIDMRTRLDLLAVPERARPAERFDTIVVASPDQTQPLGLPAQTVPAAQPVQAALPTQPAQPPDPQAPARVRSFEAITARSMDATLPRSSGKFWALLAGALVGFCALAGWLLLQR